MNKTVNKLSQQTKNLGIRSKLLVSISAVIVFTISLLIFIIVINYSHKLESNNIRVSNQIISNLTSTINDYFDEVIGITNQAAYNSDLQDLISSGNYIKQTNPDEPDLVKAHLIGSEIFGNSFDARTNITSIIVFNNNGILLYKSPYGLKSNLADFKDRPWYKQAVRAAESPVISGISNHSDITGSDVRVFSVSRVIQTTDNLPSGVILIDADLNTIHNICNSVKLDKDGQLFVLDAAGTLVYKPGSILPADMNNGNSGIYAQINDRIRQNTNGNFVINIEGKKYQIVYNRLQSAEWTAFTMVPHSSLVSDLNGITAMIIVVGVFSLILMITVMYILLTNIIRPLLVLKKCMDSSDNGNLDVRAPVESKDEIGMLAFSYNHMLDRIGELMQQVISEQKKIRKSELKALQAQINPHFLYNTLDTIVWMAEMKNENIVPTTEALAKFFRISLSRGNDLISIADELEHVRNYLVIQSMRYTNKLNFEINAAQKVKSYKTLKIILQPIVENALYHGIKNKEGPGLIKIDVLEETDSLEITVSDDGIGMEAEKCELILDDSYRRINSDGSGIGIRNVNERIKLYFGKEYGIKIESSLGIGTKVHIHLPIIRV